MKKGRKLKGKALRIHRIKRARKTRPKGQMVSINRALDYKIQQVKAYGSKSEKGHGVAKKAVQHLRTKYPELFRTH